VLLTLPWIISFFSFDSEQSVEKSMANFSFSFKQNPLKQKNKKTKKNKTRSFLFFSSCSLNPSKLGT